MLYVYLFHGHVSCLPFSWYTILLSGTLYLGTSNCLMSTYFTGMLLVYIFHGILSFVLKHCMNVLLLYVYLFHDKLFHFLVHYTKECLPFSLYTILRSGTLYVRKSNCFMYTYFTNMRLVYFFHGKLFYVLAHFM